MQTGYVVVFGCPSKGFKFDGIFQTEQSASTYLDKEERKMNLGSSPSRFSLYSNKEILPISIYNQIKPDLVIQDKLQIKVNLDSEMKMSLSLIDNPTTFEQIPNTLRPQKLNIVYGSDIDSFIEKTYKTVYVFLMVSRDTDKLHLYGPLPKPVENIFLVNSISLKSKFIKVLPVQVSYDFVCDMHENLYTVVSGSAFTGLSLHGLYPSYETAQLNLDATIPKLSYEIVKVTFSES